MMVVKTLFGGSMFAVFHKLSSLLPENAEQIEALRQLSHLELDELTKQDSVEKKFQVPVILTFMLE